MQVILFYNHIILCSFNFHPTYILYCFSFYMIIVSTSRFCLFVCLSLTVFTKNCAELYKSGQNVSGVYTINPDGTRAFDVFCDQTTAGGGWTVFQKRLDGSVDFYRGWTDYKNRFGDHEGEFWLGLDKIHRLTKTRSMLRVDLQDTSGETAHAEYDGFAVMSKSTKYQLSLGTYSGKEANQVISESADSKYSVILNTI